MTPNGRHPHKDASRCSQLPTGAMELVMSKVASECRTMTVPQAGKIYFNLERDAAYRAAQRGDLPTIRVGRTLRVPIAAMERMMEQAWRKPAAMEAQAK